MKKIIQTLALALSVGIIPAQNYIQNGDLEAGTQVTGTSQLSHATGWSGNACFGGNGVTYDFLMDAGSTFCGTSVPASMWAYNIPVRAGGQRYLANIDYVDLNLPQPSNSPTATLLPLPTTCYSYQLQFWVHTIDGLHDQNSTNYCNPTGPASFYTSRVQVTLSNSSNCSSLLVYDSPDVNQSANWQLLSSSFTLTPAQAAAGYNKITFAIVKPRNIIPYNVNFTSGQMLFMDDFSLTGNTDLTPYVSVNGAPTLCSGSPITAVGTYTGSSTPTFYDWAIDQCDQYGNLIAGGYQYDHWYAGAPSSGTFTFPNSSLVPCGNYYLVRFITVNGCVTWAEADKVIFLGCKPAVPVISGSSTVCQGTSDALWSNSTFNNSWSPGGATTQAISVTPLVSPTTYTLTITDPTSSCKSSSTFSVTILKNDPSFTLTPTAYASNYYTVQAVAVDLNAASQTNFSYEWYIDQMDATDTYPVYSYHGYYPCTWDYPNPTIFKGFGGLVTPPTSPCNTTAPGEFQYNTHYRITRGTQNANCSTRYFAYDFDVPAHPVANGGAPAFLLRTIENAPDPRELAALNPDVADETQPTVYPNPGTGQFKVAFGKGTEEGTLEIYDIMGKRVRVMEMKSGSLEYEFDLSDAPKGIYFLNSVSNGKRFSQKIIVQ